MAARNDRVREQREQNRAALAAARAGGTVSFDDDEDDEVAANVTNESGEVYDADPRDGVALVRQVKALTRDMAGIKRAIRVGPAKRRKFVKLLKAHIEREVVTVLDKVSEVESDEKNLHALASAGADDASTILTIVEPILAAGIKFINAGDTVVNPAGLQLAAGIEAVIPSLGTDSAKRMAKLVADLATAWAYYDATIGLSSIYTANGASGGGSGGVAV